MFLQVAGLSNVASLALGHQSSWALSRDGRAFCWGTDDHGSLAQGEGHWQMVPLAVPQVSVREGGRWARRCARTRSSPRACPARLT